MVQEVPGQVSGLTATFRDCLLSGEGVRFGRGVINHLLAYNGADTGYESRIWSGTPFAMITTTKLWVPCKRTTVTSAGGATATAVPVVDARAFKVGDVISVGSNTGWTITAINYTTNTLTGASITFSSSDVVKATDGSETCRGILNEDTDLYDPFTRGNVAKTFSKLIIEGLVDQRKVWGDIAAIRADTGNKLQQIEFGDDAGQTA